LDTLNLIFFCGVFIFCFSFNVNLNPSVATLAYFQITVEVLFPFVPGVKFSSCASYVLGVVFCHHFDVAVYYIMCHISSEPYCHVVFWLWPQLETMEK
jgi:hypothetical protein